MQGREEELQHEVRALQLMMERARLDASAKAGSAPSAQHQSSAAGDPLLAKYQAFKRQAAVVVMAADS